MPEILNKIRKELYKISEIDMEVSGIDTEDELSNMAYIEEFITSMPYLRKASEDEIIESYRRIFYSSTTQGMKLLFFIRDKVNGLGERRIFRVLIQYLSNEHPSYVINNLKLIPKYGRWDDLYSLFDTQLEQNVADIFRSQIKLDISSRKPSTLGKWLKSENTSSIESKRLGIKTRKLLGYSSKEYRKILSSIRKKLNIVESNLSNKDYYKINYKKLTKTNLKIYKKTFLRNDKSSYKKFISERANKEFRFKDPVNLINTIRKYLINKEINSIEDMYINGMKDIYIKNIEDIFNEKIEYQDSFEDTLIINALSNETLKSKEKYIDILITIMLLYKKANLNSFKNYYIYFNNNFKFNKLLGESYIEDVKTILNTTINNTTINNSKSNLESALDLLLFSIMKKNLKASFVPKSIMYIYNSQEDMKINNFHDINNKWIRSGYDIPKIKLWNLNELNSNFSIVNEGDFIKINGYNSLKIDYLIKGKEVNYNEFIISKFNKTHYCDLQLI